MSRILLSPPDVGRLEQEYVARALASGWVAPAGPDLDAFEAETADRVGVAHAVGLSSATAGLHLTLLAWGIGPGDVVPMTTLTFVATANAIVYTGARPAFVDVDPLTGNIDAALLDRAICELRQSGERVRAVVPVDLLGRCVDQAAVAEVATRRGVRILSDAAESFGSTRHGRPSAAFGDAAVLSFNGNKVMTTSGGGMLLTDDGATAERVRHLSTQAREPVAHYEHRDVGYNHRLSNVLAALGRAQLARLDELLRRRRAQREWYAAVLADVPGVSILAREAGPSGDWEDNCWLTAVQVDADVTGWSADDLVRHLSAHDIESRPMWMPMHLQPVHRRHPAWLDGSAEQIFRTGVVLPSGSTLDDTDRCRIAEALGSVPVGAR